MDLDAPLQCLRCDGQSVNLTSPGVKWFIPSNTILSVMTACHSCRESLKGEHSSLSFSMW